MSTKSVAQVEVRERQKFRYRTLEADSLSELHDLLVALALEVGLINKKMTFVLWTPEHPSARVIVRYPDGTYKGAMTGSTIELR